MAAAKEQSMRNTHAHTLAAITSRHTCILS